MCQPFRNKKLSFVIIRQMNAKPLAKSRRTLANVHRYIENMASYYLYKLCLSMWILIMKTPQCSFTGKRKIVLHKFNQNSQLMVF